MKLISIEQIFVDHETAAQNQECYLLVVTTCNNNWHFSFKQRFFWSTCQYSWQTLEISSCKRIKDCACYCEHMWKHMCIHLQLEFYSFSYCYSKNNGLVIKCRRFCVLFLFGYMPESNFQAQLKDLFKLFSQFSTLKYYLLYHSLNMHWAYPSSRGKKKGLWNSSENKENPSCSLTGKFNSLHSTVCSAFLTQVLGPCEIPKPCKRQCRLSWSWAQILGNLQNNFTSILQRKLRCSEARFCACAEPCWHNLPDSSR